MTPQGLNQQNPDTEILQGETPCLFNKTNYKNVQGGAVGVGGDWERRVFRLKGFKRYINPMMDFLNPDLFRKT